MAITPEYCAYCRYLDLSKKRDGLLWCPETGAWKPATCEDSLNCRRGWRVSSYGDLERAQRAINEYKKYARDNRPYKSFSWFYVSTAVIELLKSLSEEESQKEALDEQLATLENFRLDYLQTNVKYREWMLMYDTIGPALATALSVDENKKQMAMDIYMKFLVPCIELINKENYEHAYALYKDMIEALKGHYQAQAFIPEEVKARYDQQNGGNGSIRLKPIV